MVAKSPVAPELLGTREVGKPRAQLLRLKRHQAGRRGAYTSAAMSVRICMPGQETWPTAS